MEIVVYAGRRYYRRLGERYFSKNGRILHRVIWEDHYGAIPEGHCIHHRDHNPVNNQVENLQLMTYAEHVAHHRATSAHKHQRPEQLRHLAKIRPLTKAWHASPEGRQWHSENAKAAWGKRQSTDAICAGCGAAYATFFPERSRFCSPRCGNRAWEQAHKRPSRYKLVPPPAPRICEECGNEYQPVKETRRSLCTTRCRQRNYARTKGSAAPRAPAGV